MTRKLLATLGLLLSACLLALVLAEVFVRVRYPNTRDHVMPSRIFVTDDAQVGWSLRPNTSGSHHSEYYDVLYEINAFGHRDRPRRLEQDAGVYRILLLGDSQTFGMGMPAEKRFSSLLEARRPGLEVWNLGVPGFGLDQQVLLYERDGRQTPADEAIFYISPPILMRNRYDKAQKVGKPIFALGADGALELRPPRESRWLRWYGRMASGLYLPHFIDKQFGYLTYSREPVSFDEVDRKMLQRARDATRAANQAMSLMTASEDTYPELREFCAREGIHFLSIRFDGPYRDFAIGEHDLHWNERAQQLIAEQLWAGIAPRVDGALAQRSAQRP